MDSNQQPGHDPYAFIMADPQKAKRNLLPNPNSRKQRLLFVGGGGAILLILLLIGFLLFSSSRTTATKQLLSIAQTQNEVIRVSDLGTRNARSSDAQAFAQSTSLSVSSSQKEIVDYLTKQGLKTKPKDLATKQNGATDKALETASQASQYDQEFVETLTKLLKQYQTELKTAYDQTESAAQKQILQDSFNQVNVLLKNVNQ